MNSCRTHSRSWGPWGFEQPHGRPPGLLPLAGDPTWARWVGHLLWAHPAPGSTFRRAQSVSPGQWETPLQGAGRLLLGAPGPRVRASRCEVLLIPMGHRDCFPVSCLEGLELGAPHARKPDPRVPHRWVQQEGGLNSIAQVTCPELARQSPSPECCHAPPLPSLAQSLSHTSTRGLGPEGTLKREGPLPRPGSLGNPCPCAALGATLPTPPGPGIMTRPSSAGQGHRGSHSGPRQAQECPPCRTRKEPCSWDPGRCTPSLPAPHPSPGFK